MAVFWVVAPCSLVDVYQRLRAASIIRAILMKFINVSEVLAASIVRAILMMEVASTSVTLVHLYQTTRRYNPEDSHLGVFMGFV
jgi:hypothetical protein